MELSVKGIETAEVDRIRNGGADANGQPALVRTAEGVANPCRHCLERIAEGRDKLVLAHRPLDAPQPYAEVGPIFLHRDPCERYVSRELPGWFAFLEPAIVRGYGSDHWIRYDTGFVVPGLEIAATCRQILGDASIAYVHVRSKYSCFQCRVERMSDHY